MSYLFWAFATAMLSTPEGGLPKALDCEPGPALAGSCAGRHAPILWFAPEEPIHPTLPRPFAFNGIDDDESKDGQIDLADPGEVNYEAGRRLEWGPRTLVEFQNRFRPLQGDNKVGPMTVLHYGPELFAGPVKLPSDKAIPAQVEELRKALDEAAKTGKRQDQPIIIRAFEDVGLIPRRHCEDQSAYRPVTVHKKSRGWRVEVGDFERIRSFDLRDPGNGKPLVFKTEHLHWLQQPLYVHEYWFYYLYDVGAGGHLNDSEHAFVLVDQAGEVRAIVAAGHTRDEANNILVSGPEKRVLPNDPLLPARLPKHPVLLVELGKHASAPDRNFDGRFDTGLDANVYPENVWGSRDAQTALIGKAQIGRFQPWFSLPREFGSLWALHEGADLAEYVQDVPSGSQTSEPRSTVFGPSSPASRALDSWVTLGPARQRYESHFQAAQAAGRKYRLFGVDCLRALYHHLGCNDEKHEGCDGDQKARVRKWVEQHADLLPELKNAAEPLALGALRLWPLKKDMDDKREVWLHPDFKSPENVLKRSLFPLVALGPVLRVESATGVWGASVQLAGFPIGDTEILHDSTLGFSTTWDRVTPGRRWGWHDAALDYDAFRGRFRGYGLGFGWGRLEHARDGERLQRMHGFFRLRYNFVFSLPQKLGVLKILPETNKISPRLSLSFGLRSWLVGPRPERDRLTAFFSLALHWRVARPVPPLKL